MLCATATPHGCVLLSSEDMMHDAFNASVAPHVHQVNLKSS